MNVLLVSAHPDDMEIGMGGTAAKLARSGALLTSLILTNGSRSQNPFGLSADALGQLRMEEARRAANVLGVKDTHFCNLSDLKSAENYTRARTDLENVISKIAPAEIYILHPDLDRHPSHQIAGKVVLQTLKEMKYNASVWAYEVWGLFPTWDRSEDISDWISLKLRAIQEHKSQIASVPYSEGVLGLNRWRAVFADPQQDAVHAAFAEVFVRCKYS